MIIYKTLWMDLLLTIFICNFSIVLTALLSICLYYNINTHLAHHLLLAKALYALLPPSGMVDALGGGAFGGALGCALWGGLGSALGGGTGSALEWLLFFVGGPSPHVSESVISKQ